MDREIIQKVNEAGGGFILQGEAEGLCQAVRRTQNVTGDILEFGAFEGYSTALLALTAKQLGKKKVYSVEWFKGLPEPGTEDAVADCPHSKGEIKGKKETFLKRMAALGLDNVILIEKDIFESEQFLPAAPSLVFIDVDFYRTVAFCLELSRARIAMNGRIYSHDYGWAKTPGATKAIDEFVLKYGYTCERIQGSLVEVSR